MRGAQTGGQRWRLAAIAVMLLALTVAIGTAGAAAQKPGFDVEIITCPDGSTPPPGADSTSDCQSTSQKLPPPKKKGTPNVDQPRRETTEVDLGSGDQSSSGPGGDSLDLNLNARDDEGGIRSVDDPLPPPSATKLPVTTNGGAVSGTGSAFDFVSTDQALASFAVPPFLLPIYVSAGRAYNVPWNVLAAINQIETDFGRIEHQVSSAGAQGWMQFMPGTWEAYGVDASGDGIADPYNPVDAIYAAARYLSASGAPDDLRRAIFAYNHADWYVDEVLHNASIYGSLPGGLVTETGSLAFGHFPVRGPVSYGDDFREAQLSDAIPTGLRIHPRGRASAVATQDATVTRVLLSRRLARAFRRDPGRAAAGAPKPRQAGPRDAGAQPAAPEGERGPTAAAGASDATPAAAGDDPAPAEDSRPFILDWLGVDDLVKALGDEFRADENPAAGIAPPADAAEPIPVAADGSAKPAGPRIEPGADGLPKGYEVSKSDGVGVELTDPVGNRYRYEGIEKLRPQLRPGAEVEGADVLGPVRRTRPMLFSVRAAGGSQIDPRPLVDGYRLQEASDYFHAVEPIGGNPFLPDGDALAAGVVSGTQAQLANQVLNDPGISIYSCGRSDVQRGIIDKRTLGAMLYLRRAGLTLTVTSLRCGHSYYTAGGSVSAHSYGAAVDIAAFNGQPVLGNQGPGSLTEQAVKLLMGLEGAARPSQLISLMDFGGPSFALSDHADHLHVGYPFETTLGLGRSGEAAAGIDFGGAGAGGGQGLDKPQKGAEARQHEQALSERLGKIDNPTVPSATSPGAPRVEGERHSDRKATEHGHSHGPSFTLMPSASGADLTAIDMPGRGGEAYAIGVVNGAAHGWDEEQTVVLARSDGGWDVVGPPRDPSGKIANPKLRELATLPGGNGYSVGKNGALVQLRGSKPPILLRSGTSADLRDVDAAAGLRGYAVGAEGTVLRLDGARVTRERGADQASLAAVTLDGAQPLAAGTGAGRPAVFSRQGSGAWTGAELDLGVPDGAAVVLEDVAAGGGETWVAGSFADSTGTPLTVPFAARRSGGGWTTYCSPNPALSVVQELGERTAGPCDHSLPSSTAGASASSVVPTADGALVAAGSLLTSVGGREQLSPAAAPEPIADLAAISQSQGLILGSLGRLVELGSGAAIASRSTNLPLANAPSVMVASGGADRSIAFAGGQTATLSPEGWTKAASTGLAVRDAAFLGDRVWAVDELGSPIAPAGGGWTGQGEDDSDRELRADLARQVGGLPLTTPDAKRSGDDTGLGSIAFADDVGYAVGGELIGTYHPIYGWRYSDSGEILSDVAAGPGGVVAVGEAGTVLVRDGDRWNAQDVGDAAAGTDLTAAAAADDGTLLAAGDGVVLARPDGGAWAPLDLPPLGVEIRRLAAFDGEGDPPVVFALVDAGGEFILLRGHSGRWHPVAIGPGISLTDMTAVPGEDQLLLGGSRFERAIVIEVAVGETEKTGRHEDHAGKREAGGSGGREGDEGGGGE